MTTVSSLLPERYESVEELGSSTLVVQDRERDERLLLRVLRPEDGARIRRELERMRGLDEDPRLARILELGELEDGRAYYVQELVEGEDLFQWALARDASEVIAVWSQLLLALDCYHQLGLVPRGERPMSIRVVPSEDELEPPRLRLVDPGGVIDEGSRELRAGQGLAPERRVGARIDRRASLYEAGLILYELLSSSDAFELPALDDQTTQSLPPGLPADLATFVMVLLRPFPDERPNTVQAALANLEQISGQRLSEGLRAPRLPAPTPLIGRAAELARLRAWAEPLLREGTSSDETSLALIAGPRGAGRERLADELALRLGLEDVLVLRGRCGEQGQGPFGPLGELLRLLSRRRLLSEVGTDAAWVLRALLPERAAALPDGLAPPAVRDAELSRQRVLDALVEHLLAAARKRPLALLLDAVDEARPETLALLSQTARAVALARREHEQAPRLLIVGTCRRLPELDSQLGVGTIQLPALDAQPLRDLAAAALGLDDEEELPAEVREAVELRSEGNPGRALERVREHLQRDAPEEDEPEQPDELGARLLAVLACLRRPVDLHLLAQGARTSLSAAHGAILTRLQRGEVTRLDDRYRLAGAKVGPPEPALAGRLARFLAARLPAEPTREALLEVVELAALGGEGDLLRRHAPEVIEWLAELGAEDRAAELALALAGSSAAGEEHEGDEGDEGSAAREWRLRAAKLLLRCHELERSEQLLRELIDEPGERSPTEAAEHYQLLTEGLLLRAREREARAALGWAHTYLADQEGVELERARLCAQAAQLDLEAELGDDARARCEEGLVLISDASGEGPELARWRAELLGQLGSAATLDEDPREARRMHEAALAIQEREGLAEDAARTLARLGRVAFEAHDDVAAEERWRRALEACEGLRDLRGAAQVCSSLALVASRQGRLADARELLERSLRLRDTIGDLAGAAASLHNLGYVYRCAGALDEAAAAYRRALRLRLDLEDRWYAALAANNLAEVLCDLGRPDEARPYVRQALTAHRELGDRLGEAQSLSILAELDRRRGELGGALRGLEQVRRIRSEQEDLEGQLDTLRLETRLELSLGRSEQARRAAERALKLCEEHEVLALFEPSTRLLLGQVHARRRRGRGRARRELERSRRLAERLGERFTARAATIELAGLRLASGDPRDARALLDSRPVPRPGRMQPLQGSQPPDRRGQLRVRERLLRARIELALPDGSVTTAARCAEQALETARRAELSDLTWRALQVAAACAELRGAHERALELTLEAQELVEQVASSLPEARREEFLGADPLRGAALRGDSPVQALDVQARAGSGEGSISGEEAMLTAMVESTRPTIQPASRAPAPPPGVPAAAPVESQPGAEFALLVRLNRMVVDEPNLAVVQEAIVREVVGMCRAERGFLALFEDTPDTATVLATVGIDEVERGQRFFRRCAFKSASTGQVVLSAEARVRAETKQEAHVVGLGLRSLLAVPITVPDGRRGSLYLDASFQVGLFTDREVELACALADLSAMAVGRGVLETALHGRGGPAPGHEQRRFLEAHTQAELAPVSFGEGDHRLVGRSNELRTAIEGLEAAAREGCAVLISGPPGVGKGVAARALHAVRAAGQERPLIKVDLRDLRADRIEAELFGYAPGALPGVEGSHRGLLASARGGTLLFEHLPEAPLELQRKLCGALEDGCVRPLGGEELVPLEAQVVVTTSEVPDDLLRAGRFDEALAMLVSMVHVELPALDRRPNDKGPLIDLLLDEWARERPEAPPVLTSAARAALEARSYPGNARELNAVLSAGVVLADERPIQPEDLPLDRGGAIRPLRLALADFERRYIEDALLANRADLTATAKALGISRRSLKRKLEQLRIAP